ncbi:MAG: hypothetical protein JW754_02720 [Candidatus Aenigmarchaeota archaeon]|nr:hypothetical protein [Candidatus Aenigmarchaeota archaeon]
MIGTYPVSSESRVRQTGRDYDDREVYARNKLFRYFSELSEPVELDDIRGRGIDIMNIGDVPRFKHYVWLQDPSTNGVNSEASFTLFDGNSGTMQGELKPKTVAGEYTGMHVFVPKEMLE